MVSTTGFGLFSDFAVLHGWAGEMWAGNYTGLYPFPLMVLLAPISRLPLDTAAVLWIAACLMILVLVLGRSSLYWMLFVPFLQGIFLGQIDPFFLPIYRSKRPAVWALLSLKPQLLLLALPKIFASRRNTVEFTAAALGLHLPFLLLRPRWPLEWLDFIAHYQNRVAEITQSTVSGQIVLSWWVLPFAALLIGFVVWRRKNFEGATFLINPLLLPYDYTLLMGAVSKLIIPISWLALALAWKVQAGWPYILMMMGVLAYETVRERRAEVTDNDRESAGTLSGR
jgi:hypothetical protein